jgi:hypothetical protein
MSTQSYYKDRLGFDPREALYEGAPVKGGASGGGGGAARGQQPNHNQHQNKSNGHHRHESYQSPTKKQKSQASPGGYEDALTQFKGTMSLWEYFVENTDVIGMSKMIKKKSKFHKHTILLLFSFLDGFRCLIF